VTATRGARLWLAAWFGSAVLWLVLTDSVRVEELLAGALVSALAATAAEFVRRQRVAPQAVRPRYALRVWRVLLGAIPDVARLTRAAFAQVVQRRPVRGTVVAIPFGHTGDEPDAAARRALAIGLGSVAPNSVVIGVDRESGLLLVHQLESTREPDDLDPLRLR
jgi:multisubunit Na+/H+ antiporter MnhE subunit